MKNLKGDLRYYYLKNLNPNNYDKYIKNEYERRIGEKLNLEAPKKYTEKMQYAKLYLNSPLKTHLTDKYLVREWVADKIGKEYLIPLLGVWDNYEDIDFDELPKQFVLKTNHSSGWNLVVKDKNLINHEKEKKKFDRWMKRNFAYYSNLQLHYKDIEPKIIAEEYLEDSDGELKDYKFMCFNGEVHFCWLDIGRFSTHYRNTYDLEWQLLPWNQASYPNYPEPIKKPESFEKMVELAQALCKDFSHVRVDLYYVEGKIYFGEMTFTSGSGYDLIVPDEYNRQLGELWKLEN